jgi:hypothetical protein
MILGLLDPDSDPLVRDTDPDLAPDPKIFFQKCVERTEIMPAK